MNIERKNNNKYKNSQDSVGSPTLVKYLCDSKRSTFINVNVGEETAWVVHLILSQSGLL